jgi:hypothetical protein
MNMKNILIIALSAFLSLTFGCANAQEKDHLIFGNKAFVIQNYADVTLFEVESYATKLDSQDKKKQYINDYQIIKKIDLSRKEKKYLQESVLEVKNYETKTFKSCPFVAKYAIVFTKGEEQITLIISAKSCEKVIIFDKKDVKNTKNYDLNEKNSIEEKILKILD